MRYWLVANLDTEQVDYVLRRSDQLGLEVWNGVKSGWFSVEFMWESVVTEPRFSEVSEAVALSEIKKGV
tara:strand:+ start:303 stop:509 length:207 start_codon:yes stop_codon:yes gene_type:complete